MKRFIVPILFSMALHGLLGYSFYLWKGSMSKQPVMLQVDLMPDESIPPIIPEPVQQVQATNVSNEPVSPATQDTTPEEQSAVESSDIVIIDSLTTFSHLNLDSTSVFALEAWRQFVLKKQKEMAFIKEMSDADIADSLVNLLSQMIFKDPGVVRDEVADNILERNQGNKPLPSITGLMSQIVESVKERNIPPRFDFIPSDNQIQAMAVAFDQGSANQMDMYAKLSNDQPITAEGFNHSLDLLVKKGFLARKKISPQAIFTLFGIPIEMSAQNRRNPLYLYTPKIEKNKLIDYLQSRLYLMEDRVRRVPSDSTRLNPRIQSLRKKLQYLLL